MTVRAGMSEGQEGCSERELLYGVLKDDEEFPGRKEGHSRAGDTKAQRDVGGYD